MTMYDAARMLRERKEARERAAKRRERVYKMLEPVGWLLCFAGAGWVLAVVVINGLFGGL